MLLRMVLIGFVIGCLLVTYWVFYGAIGGLPFM